MNLCSQRLNVECGLGGRFQVRHVSPLQKCSVNKLWGQICGDMLNISQISSQYKQPVYSNDGTAHKAADFPSIQATVSLTPGEVATRAARVSKVFQGWCRFNSVSSVSSLKTCRQIFDAGMCHDAQLYMHLTRSTTAGMGFLSHCWHLNDHQKLLQQLPGDAQLAGCQTMQWSVLGVEAQAP